MKPRMGTTAIALFAAAFALLVGWGAPVAVAQQYPPPTPTEEPETTDTPDDGPACDLATCLRMSGEVGDSFRSNQVEEGGDIRVVAIEGCCEANARVDVYIESVRTYLGTVTAAEDGSYRADLTLPASIEPGEHTLIADIEGCGELRRSITVLAVSTGTSVGGISQTNDDDGGVLPRTGGGIALLVMWALALVTLGTLLVKATRRRFSAARVGHHGALVEIPRVDTSRFVPYRSRTSRRPEERNLTEWTYGSERPPS